MDELPLQELWVYLSGSPLLSLTITLGCYVSALGLFNRFDKLPLLNPVLVSIVILVTALHFMELPYREYFEGAQFVHFLLGPATVALALPLHRERAALGRRLPAIALALAAGFATTASCVFIIAWMTGLDDLILLSIIPKSVTAPVAMGISERLGGIPALTAVFAVVTGVTGAVVSVPLLNRLKISDDSAKGLAIGLVSHGIGTARAFQISERAGAYSGLAMALTAMITAVLMPWLATLLGVGK